MSKKIVAGQDFGNDPLKKLLSTQAIPASIGVLVMSIYGIVDTVFVGRWIGSMAIGAITVVLPITFLIASIGLAIGVGGASIISRALGAENDEKAYRTFGNQIFLTLGLCIGFSVLGFVFKEEMLNLFGGKGEVLAPAKEYFTIILIGIPFLGWAMMSNNVVRAEGYPKIAMYTLIIPAVTNIALDPIFIIVLDMGMKGAAWATTIAYMFSAFYTLWYFIFGKSQLRIRLSDLKPLSHLVKEITSVGFPTFARQGSVAVMYIVLNNALFKYGGELGLSIFGVVNRFLLFVIFPILGIAQGSVPIVGFNYGAEKWKRVQKMLKISTTSATFFAFVIFAFIMIFTPALMRLFTRDVQLIEAATPAMRTIFLMTPLIAINVVGGAYYQAIGRSLPALFITLSRQIFFLIPLVYILPQFFDLWGIWISFPIADAGASLMAFILLWQQNKKLESKINQGSAVAGVG